MFIGVAALTVAMVTILQGAATVAGWSYEDAHHWPEEYPGCGGLRQSPINVDRVSSVYSPTPPLRFTHYDTPPTALVVSNTGHNLQVKYKCPVVPAIAGAGLGSSFIFSEYHFHWGSEDSLGSEHTVDGVRHPMEIHFIHYNSLYGNLTTAATKPDGIAILALLFTLSHHDNLALGAILDHVEHIYDYDSDDIHREVNSDNSAFLPPFAALLPPHPQRFYRYRGSLTSPTCNEVVLWTVFEEPSYVSRRQLTILRTLLDDEGDAISNNFRPTQPRSGRLVTKSFFFSKYRPPARNSLRLCWSLASYIKEC